MAEQGTRSGGDGPGLPPRTNYRGTKLLPMQDPDGSFCLEGSVLPWLSPDLHFQRVLQTTCSTGTTPGPSHSLPYFHVSSSFFWPHQMACGILVPQPGIEPVPLAVKARSPNHWTTREFPPLFKYLKMSFSFHLPTLSQSFSDCC